MKRLGLNVLAGVMIATLCVQVKADVVFQADFDTPEQIVTKGGQASLITYSTNKSTIETVSPFAAESRGFLRVDATADSKPGHAGGVMIKPESAASSFAAMSQIVDGKVVLNGAFDFFFRSSEALDKGMGVVRAFDISNANGLRLIYLSRDGKPRLELLGPKGTSPFILSNGKPASVIAPEIGLVMEAKTVYHLAVGFVTDDKGTVTMTMYATEGAVAIDSKDALVKLSFTLDATALKAGFGDGPVFFGKSGQAGTPTSQDFDCFRIFNKLPETFEALK